MTEPVQDVGHETRPGARTFRFLPLLRGCGPGWLPQRLWLMLIGWGAIGLAYGSAHWLQGAGRSLPELLPDRLLPFHPLAVWPYLSMFILVPLAYLRCPPQRQYALAAAMQCCAAAAWLCFMLFPTALAAYPAPDPGTISGWLLHGLMQVDSPQNCLPSLHAALTLLCVHALYRDGSQTRTRAYNLALWLWGGLIALSIIVLRRHLFIDLIAGLLLGQAAAMYCGLAGKRALPAAAARRTAPCRSANHPAQRETLQ
ncbi:phosphatase PAP2 family protein [Kerstersia gyiorum]|uniref:phosphatase PAP2 family protein n=1 Tax=Kerstersia gyiorum TaxID=206506 RepID=UPI0021500AE9|nr:phosphatase PAP2 family protein [Kerstersia gyiorum]MCR4159010.1 phosphatase PAP2 family protein [Kerstersia gyiorum]